MEAVRTIRIKRKRDEPQLETFVLGGSASKRPALAQLSLGAPAASGPSEKSADGAIAEPSPRARVRFRLVGTSGAGGFAARDERLQRGQRLQGRQQAAARFERVATHRLDEDSATKGVELELRRCAPAKPKLVPFGSPLPPSTLPPAFGATKVATQPSSRWTECSGAADAEGDELADVWREAAAAAGLESGEGAKGDAAPAEDSEFVYDIYEVEAPGKHDAEDADPEVWYEELDAAAVHELEAMTSEHDSQSEGEQDYPDEESEVDSADSADDDYDGSRQWRASRRGGSDDYLNMVW